MTKDLYKDMEVRVSGQDLLDMFREVDENGEPMYETVRLEISEDGDYYFSDANWFERDDTILTQTFERYDWLENVDDEVDMNYWVPALNEFYHDNPIEVDTERYTEDGEEDYVVEHNRILIVFYWIWHKKSSHIESLIAPLVRV